MQIKNLFIKQYGPITDRDYQFQPGFNLLFGPNEKGKSLTFDALVKLLFGKDSKQFDSINRVAEQPGEFGSFVTIAHQQKQKEITSKLQGKPSLTDLVNLSAEECQNLFFIRNSQLSIGQDLSEQDQFYTNITDRLTGLKTQEIQDLKDELRDMAQLTERTDKFQSTQDNQQLGERLEQAQQLLKPEGKIGQLIAQDQREQWSVLEVKALRLHQESQRLNQQLAKLEQAQHKQEYQSVKKSLDKIQEVELKLKDLQAVSQEQIEAFNEHQHTLSYLEESKQELKQELKTKQKQHSKIKQDLSKIEKKIAQQEQGQQQIQHQFQPQLDRVKNQIANNNADQLTHTWQWGLMGSATLLILTIIAYMLQPATVVIVAMIVFGLTTLVTGWQYLQQVQKQQSVANQIEHLRLSLNEFGIESREIEPMLRQLRDKQQQFQALQQQQLKLSMENKQLREDIAGLKNDKLKQVRSKVHLHQQGLEKIRTQADVKNLKELQAKLKDKQQLQQAKQEKSAILEEKLGKPQGFIRDDVKFWQQKMQPLKKYADIKVKTQYSAQKVEEIKEKRQAINQSLEKRRQQLTTFKQQLRDLQRIVNNVLKEREEPLLCQSMADLTQAKQEIEKFIAYHQQSRQNILDTIAILEEIEEEDKQKVGALFGAGSLISQHFSRITNDHYQQVFFDSNTNRINVERADDQILQARQLSAGTYDQLYFSIRLGLGQKLLGEEKGFFIMDDPFLKADQKRLQQQMQMLFTLAKQSWQIIYFSAKEEIKAIVEETDANLVAV